jgi:DNA-binding NarL/FixJ family response regulator
VAAAPIRVLLVDDHEVVRLGLITLMQDRPDLAVVGEAGSAAEALRLVEQLRPDVVLMDIRMPGQSGLEATRQIAERFPQTKVVVLTSYADDELVVRAIRAGAVGYVLKQVGNEELLRAIAAAARGEALLDSATTARLLARVRVVEAQAEAEVFRSLSERELEVLAEVARGKTNAEIGRTLNLSEKTVRNYLSSVLEKLGLSNRIELATFAVEHRLFEWLRRPR